MENIFLSQKWKAKEDPNKLEGKYQYNVGLWTGAFLPIWLLFLHQASEDGSEVLLTWIGTGVVMTVLSKSFILLTK